MNGLEWEDFIDGGIELPEFPEGGEYEQADMRDTARDSGPGDRVPTTPQAGGSQFNNQF